MDLDHWTVEAEGYRFEEYLGRPSLRLEQGMAVVNEAQLENGIIEFDIAIPEALGFSGVMWRLQDLENFEEFYLRHHLSGKPDANQYSPVFNGLSGWQLYTGSNHSAAVEYEADQWMHIKLVVAGDRAEVYIDSQDPVLRISDLKRPTLAGRVGLKSSGAPVHYSNFRYERIDNMELADSRVSPLRPPAGTVSKWQVSTPFPETELDGRFTLSEEMGHSWRDLSVEDSGIANLARLHGVGEEGDTVLARVVINSDRQQTKRVRFGFSDRARVYLNRVLLFAGDDRYRSRDYRFLGTVGLFDELYLRLEPGANELLFAVTEEFGGWGIICQIDE